jgi:hypothetical protein
MPISDSRIRPLKVVVPVTAWGILISSFVYGIFNSNIQSNLRRYYLGTIDSNLAQISNNIRCLEMVNLSNVAQISSVRYGSQAMRVDRTPPQHETTTKGENPGTRTGL